MAAYINVGEADFQNVVLDSDKPVVVDFWAPWCGPGRAIAPHIETLATEYAGRAVITKVNVDENQGIAQRYGIRGIPAILLFKNGEVADMIQGMRADIKVRLIKMVDDAL
jgi:thioredoxin 1